MLLIMMMVADPDAFSSGCAACISCIRHVQTANLLHAGTPYLQYCMACTRLFTIQFQMCYVLSVCKDQA